MSHFTIKKKLPRQPESAKTAVEKLLKKLHFDPQRYAIFDIWDKEAGRILKGTKAIAIHGNKVVVKVPSAVHRQEATFMKKRILDHINQAMGHKAVQDIQFELQKEGEHGDTNQAK